MKTVRTHVRRKLPVEVFYDKNHMPLIDFSFGGVGVNFKEVAPPEQDNIRLTLIFPYQGKNVGWEVNAKVVRVDHKTKFAAFEFIPFNNRSLLVTNKSSPTNCISLGRLSFKPKTLGITGFLCFT